MKTKSLHDLVFAYLFNLISSPPFPHTTIHVYTKLLTIHGPRTHFLLSYFHPFVCDLSLQDMSFLTSPPSPQKKKKKLSTSFKTRHYFGAFLNFPFCPLPEVAHFSRMLFIYLRSIYFITLCLPHRLCELFRCRVTISNFTRVASAPIS